MTPAALSAWKADMDHYLAGNKSALRRAYPRAGERWSTGEDRALLRRKRLFERCRIPFYRYRKPCILSELARAHGRTIDSIRARLAILKVCACHRGRA